MQILTVAACVVLATAGFQTAPAAASPGQADYWLVTLIDDVQVPADLPAQQGGRLVELNVSEGDYVTAGQVLGRIDNAMEKIAEEVARYQLDVAKLQADNDVSVRYARKAAEVAEYVYRAAKGADEAYKGSIAKTELARLLLEWEQMNLQIEQSQHDLDVAKISVNVRMAQHELAVLDLGRREIKSPVDGVVEEVFPDVGEWLRAGDPVLRVVRMDKLHVEGYLSTEEVPHASLRRDMEFKFPVRGYPTPLTARINFVSPLIETGSRYKVRAVVTNEKDQDGQWVLWPGMQVSLPIRRGPQGKTSQP